MGRLKPVTGALLLGCALSMYACPGVRADLGATGEMSNSLATSQRTERENNGTGPVVLWLFAGSVLALACLSRTETNTYVQGRKTESRRVEQRRRLRRVDQHFPGKKHGTVRGRLFDAHGKAPKSRQML